MDEDTETTVDTEVVEEEVSTEESSPESTDEVKEAPKGKGAQQRIQELVGKTKTMEAELNEARQAVKSRDDELSKLIDLMQERENDTRVVARINELHADPKYKDKIEELDRAIRGVDEEIEENEEPTDKKPDNRAEKLFQAERQKLSEELADQRAELLLHKSELVIDKYMASLPDEYTEDDRRIISKLMPDNIDWNAIEDDPNQLNELIAAGIQQTLNDYGKPRGAASKTEDKEDDPPPTPQKRLEVLKSQDYGKLKTVQTPNGKKVVPEYSDQDFQKILADALAAEREAAQG